MLRYAQHDDAQRPGDNAMRTVTGCIAMLSMTTHKGRDDIAKAKKNFMFFKKCLFLTANVFNLWV